MICCSDGALYRQNLQLARAFAPDFIWLLNGPRTGGSVNDAANRQGVPMFASELFGGGRVSRELSQNQRRRLPGNVVAGYVGR